MYGIAVRADSEQMHHGTCTAITTTQLQENHTEKFQCKNIGAIYSFHKERAEKLNCISTEPLQVQNGVARSYRDRVDTICAEHASAHDHWHGTARHGTARRGSKKKRVRKRIAAKITQIDEWRIECLSILVAIDVSFIVQVAPGAALFFVEVEILMS